MKVSLYGPSSLDGGKPAGKTNGMMWKVKEITPGAIAWAATIVSFNDVSDKR